MKNKISHQHHSGMTMTRTALAFAMATALCGFAATGIATAAVSSAQSLTVAHATSLRDGDALIGALPMTQPIHVEVALKMRDRAGLDALIADNAKKQMAHSAPRLMTSEEFLANHAPTPAQAQAVVAYLTSMGFTHITIAPNRMLVSADGTAWTAGNAFKTRFAQVRTHDGRFAFANTDDVRIPAELGDKVLAVVGLQTVHQAQTFVRRASSGSVHPLVVTGHDTTEFASIYGGAGLVPASDVVVGIVTQGALGPTRADLATFAANAGLPAVGTQTINTNGTSADTANTVEWDLDSQSIVGMAGGQVRRIVFYNIPDLSNANLVADFNTIAVANVAKIVNVSIGECETAAHDDGSADAADAIFATAVAQGQTFSIATGDSGADECGDGGTTPSWPASSPYVIAVAGTSLHTIASTDAWNSETVWSDSGGSESTFESKPSWQTLWTGANRGVADVAFDGDPNSGAKIILNGSQAQYGGTSLSAPLFAGAWARVLQVYPAAGFAGPMLYALPAADFHDITSGSNGIPADDGYDLASGRGSMILHRVVDDAGGLGNQPPTANWSYATTGLTATFTDASTDSDGAIAKYLWKFGDGVTSTAANPSHAYGADGAYSVTETVTDAFGAKASRIQTVVVQAAAGPIQLLGNTGFETGTAAPWNVSSAAMLFNSGIGAHTGTWSISIGKISSSSTDVLSQEVTIPSNESSATLAFYAKSGQGNNLDAMAVDVYALSKVRLGRLASYKDFNLAPVYVLKTLDMTPYMGQTVILKFIRHNTNTGPKSTWEIPWALDDITLTVQ